MSPKSAVISLGSNIDALINIDLAVSILYNRFDVINFAGPVQTTPVGLTDQPDFFNAAILLNTDLDQPALIHSLKEIEDEVGRDRSRPHYGPREIDLDLVLWNGDVVDNDYYERDFLRKLVDEVLKD
ncbi:MAG: 2-amino-4-hydroxy-6-hydroxymethyldihydropteridine diphosphokinase [Marinilabiliaceae bacterium]